LLPAIIVFLRAMQSINMLDPDEQLGVCKVQFAPGAARGTVRYLLRRHATWNTPMIFRTSVQRL
jgi:hypothetical protein